MRILVAEDETIIRLDLKDLLERAGHEVCAEARDGEEAVELARSEQPDLAIMDVKMPRVDGIEAARQILEERPIPIVMLTAYGQEELVSRAVEEALNVVVTRRGVRPERRARAVARKPVERQVTRVDRVHERLVVRVQRLVMRGEPLDRRVLAHVPERVRAFAAVRGSGPDHSVRRSAFGSGQCRSSTASSREHQR